MESAAAARSDGEPPAKVVVVEMDVPSGWVIRVVVLAISCVEEAKASCL